MSSMPMRSAAPGDYDAIARVIDDWWGRPVLGSIARSDGRTVVSAITAIANGGSVAFHRALGFSVTGPAEDYDGPGRAMVVFERVLERTGVGILEV